MLKYISKYKANRRVQSIEKESNSCNHRIRVEKGRNNESHFTNKHFREHS